MVSPTVVVSIYMPTVTATKVIFSEVYSTGEEGLLMLMVDIMMVNMQRILDLVIICMGLFSLNLTGKDMVKVLGFGLVGIGMRGVLSTG